MRKCLGFTIAIVLVISAMVVFIPPKSVEADGFGDYPPPGVGDWTINMDTYVGNETIILNGNLTVEPGAMLTFRNVTLILNSSVLGDCFIEVKSGATFLIYDIDNNNLTTNDASNITAKDSNFPYFFWVRDGSNFTMKNSELHRCGLGPSFPEYMGIYIQTDNATIDHNLISKNYDGIILYGSDALVSNNTIEWNDYAGVVSMIWSNGTIENNWIDSNWVYGIRVNGGSNSDPKPSNPTIINNTILDTGRGINTANGIHVEVFSNPIIMNNKILRSTEDGIYAGQECRAVIINNTIDNGNIGNYGIATSDMGYLKVVNTSISNTVLWDISVADGEVNVINTSFNQSKVIFQNVAPQTFLTTEWYLHTKVIDGSGNPISDVNVRIMDNANGTYDENYTTDSNGFVNWTVLTEYFQKDNTGDKDGDDIGEKIFYTPHNFTVSKPGYFTSYAEVEMNESKFITITLTPDLEYNITLNEGWNLVSLPLEQSDESIDQVLSSITGKWDCIQAYDAFNGTWLSNATFKPDQLNDLKTLNHKQGFWINVTEPNVNLTVRGHIPGSTSIPLYAGWNLVGYPTQTTETVANALWGTGADRVEVFNATAPYRIREVGPTYIMKPGEGYWVHVPANSVWIIDW